MRSNEFFENHFKIFSQLDNVRSIPSLVDGLKDSQRKAVFGMIEHGQSEIKVAQLAGFASLRTHYDHGEASMGGTIVGLAQRFPGANNVNLFEPIGQFGSILSAIPSATRYIYTKPSQLLKNYLRVEDNCILDFNYRDGDRVEPKYYLPVLPMWAVNGALGIGTGHATKILPRNPKSVKKLVDSIINSKAISKDRIEKLSMPHFIGWKGTVERLSENQYSLTGIVEKVNTTTLKVTELPVGYDVDKFKSILVKLMDENKVKDFDNNSSEDGGFDFTISVPREVGKQTILSLTKLFKLTTTVTENITLWNAEGELIKYDDFFSALCDFCVFRVDAYEKRRLKQIEIVKDRRSELKLKAAFIEFWNQTGDKSKLTVDEIKKMFLTKVKTDVDDGLLDRFMSMSLKSLSMDLISGLEREIFEIDEYIDYLEDITNTKLFTADLECL